MKTLKCLFVLCIMLGLAVPANSQGKQVEKPFKGTFYSEVLGTIDNGTRELLSITGNATHMGIVLNSFMKFDKPPAPHYLEGFIKAANGDCIYFYGWPTMETPPAGIMHGTFYISGGTGRFTGCYGECQMTGSYNMIQDWAMWSLDGTITY